jgi:hypothetical protein
MFRLDYLSCFLTIVATVLVGRKSWTGLLASIVNSLVVCIIGFRTSQFGFIPANLVCICVYAFSIRSWLKKTHTHGSPCLLFASYTATRPLRDARKANDRPSIGVLLCASKDDEVVKYALSRTLSPALIAGGSDTTPRQEIASGQLHEFYLSECAQLADSFTT